VLSVIHVYYQTYLISSRSLLTDYSAQGRKTVGNMQKATYCRYSGSSKQKSPSLIRFVPRVGTAWITASDDREPPLHSKWIGSWFIINAASFP